jgi:hypothetical protein
MANLIGNREPIFKTIEDYYEYHKISSIFNKQDLKSNNPKPWKGKNPNKNYKSINDQFVENLI